MTCIVGLKHEGKVYMGADSAIVAGWVISEIANPKIFKKENMLIGYTSTYRMGQILEHWFYPPKNEGYTDYEYMVLFVVEEIRSLFSKFGYSEIDNNVEKGGFFIIGYRGELYKIQDDYSVIQHTDDYIATGSGEEIALGALYAGADFPPKMRISQSLEAAAKHSASVCKPFVLMDI